jgi:16S rRNA (cytidine1402-2'-O)-methyltransferase
MTDTRAPGTLYLVPTPIGNDHDLSGRAIEVLRSAGLVAAEDTRVTAALLRRLGLQKRLISYHDHNELQRAPWLLEQLAAGTDVALVSDAGTPEISDPGYRIVALAAEHGIPIRSLPGPSAVLTALVASGLPTDRFYFVGFLPRRAPQRRTAIAELRRHPSTLILFEGPHRALETLAALIEGFGDRVAMIGWNMTKPDERSLRGSLSSLHAELASWEYVHGEFTIVVAGAAPGSDTEAWPLAERTVRLLLSQGLSAASTTHVVVELSGLPRRRVYDLVLTISHESDRETQSP